jgi:putative SOS response-associated peptidase YedK
MVAELAALLAPYPAEVMAAVRVGPAVNNQRNDDERCVEPAA